MAYYYQCITGAMIFFIALSYLRYKCVNAICWLILFSFLTFHVINSIDFSDMNWVVIDSIRVAALMIACLVFGMKTIKPIPYLCYSLVLFGFIFTNGLFLIDPALAPQELYVALTIMEVALFIQGMSAVYNAKTKNDSILNSNSNSFRYSVGRWLNRSNNAT